ncbi:MAG: cytochrome c [Bacteroidetes bacterium]|nr:cytochrome c [Bacteroidota bacterium]
MYTILYQTHKVAVLLFLGLYLVKTILLLTNNKTLLDKITKVAKVPEMIISTLFLLTGIYMITQIPVITTLLIVKVCLVLASIPVAIIGFKKSNKALALLSLIMIVMSYGLAEMHKKSALKSMQQSAVDTTIANNVDTVNTVVAEVAPIDGKTVFMSNCIVCHGANGKLGAAGAKDLTVTALDKNAIKEIVTNGKGAMAPFGAILTADEIDAVGTYVDEVLKEHK